MKIRVTMKSPDALSDAIGDAVERMRYIAGNSNDEDFDQRDACDELFEECSKWFTYGEYLTVEIDTETGEAVVIPAK